MTDVSKIKFESLKIVKKRFDHSQKINYDFGKIMEAVMFIGRKLIIPGKEFTLSPERHELYSQLIFYFFNDPQFKGDLNKGLMLRGGRGTGKTMAMNVFRILSFNGVIPMQKAFGFVNCDEIVNNYEMSGPKSFQAYLSDTWCFDDVGNENRFAMHFGNPRNVMRDILTKRYREFTELGTMTYITTNFDFQLIDKEYGKRVEDRFYEMFNDIILDGKSLR